MCMQEQASRPIPSLVPCIPHFTSSHFVSLCAVQPFSETSEPMVRACIRRQTHYLDVTGETGVIRRVKETHGEAAEKSGVMLMPGEVEIPPSGVLHQVEYTRQ